MTLSQARKANCRGRGNAGRPAAESRLRQGAVLRHVCQRQAAAVSRFGSAITATTAAGRRAAALLPEPKSIRWRSTARRDSARASSTAWASSACSAHACRKSAAAAGFTQTQYCRLIEVLGGHCGSTALFVNAHHSIGPRALVLFGTPEQQAAIAAEAGQRRVDQRLRPDRARGRQRRGQRADHGHADGRRPRLHAQRPETLDHQRRHRAGADRDGPHAGAGQQARPRSRPSSSRPTCRASRSSRSAMPKCGVRGTATAPAGVPRHVRAEGEHPRPARQRPARRADGARLRPHDVRRQLHRRGQVLRRTGRRSTPTRACSSARRSASSSWSRRSSPTWRPARSPWKPPRIRRPR